MAYLYGLTKAYDINEARRRARYFEEQSERNLWEANEALKKDIDQQSYRGETWACVDLLFKNYMGDGEQASIVTSADLADMYRDAGYKVDIKELFDSVDDDVKGYRVEVSWEEN